MTVVLIFTISIAVALVLAAFYYIRRPVHKVQMLLLLAIRIAAIAALLAAFFEPVFHFTRFATSSGGIAVLIDASQSMQMFGADSLVRALDKALAKHGSSGGRKGARISYFCFGDSLRPCPPLKNVAFADSRSAFPLQLNQYEAIRNASAVVIVSDGSWSNAYRPRASIERTNSYYIRMPTIANRPFLQVHADAMTVEAVRDSVAHASISIHGYKRSREAIELSCFRRAHRITGKRAEFDSGFFADTVLLRLPTSRVGTFLYTIGARVADDSLFAATHILHHVMQQSFTASLYAPSPSLDKRFLMLALAKSDSWRMRKRGTGHKRSDAVFFLEFNDEARRIVRSLPSSASGVFIGCLPCSGVNRGAPSQFEAYAASDYAADTAAACLPQLPPPTALLSCSKFPGRAASPVLVARTSKHGAAAADSAVVLFEDSFNFRRVMILGARGTWRWHFWPLSFGDIQHTSCFAHFLLNRVSELVKANTNRALYAYPEKSPVYESDSAALRIVVPMHIRSTMLKRLRISLTNAQGDTVIDTVSKDIFAGGRALRHTLSPLPAGAYAYSVHIRSSERRASYADTLHVHEGNAELHVSQQNVLVLGQLATALDFADGAAAAARIYEENSLEGKKATERKAVHIRQTWYLLAVVLFLMAVEWALRKQWRLD
jgi:hypothetical protein